MMQTSKEFKKKLDDPIEEDSVINVFNHLRQRYGYTLRISMILQFLKDIVLQKKEFDLIDLRVCSNALIESYLIDRLIDFRNNKETNFSEIYKKICSEYPFSSSEKLIFESINIEEKLWAFFLALSKSQL